MMLARDSFQAKEIWWIMIKVFFGQVGADPWKSLATNAKVKIELPWLCKSSKLVLRDLFWKKRIDRSISKIIAGRGFRGKVA